jgi:drug/metabolite transporter (DMT)-like permease
VNIGIVLLVASAALHAAWNALLKREPDKLASVLAVLAVADSAATLVAFATGFRLPAAALGWAIAAGCAEAGYFVALAYALTQASYGVAYTVSRGGAMLAVWIVSALWLHERVDAWILAGVALLFAGLLLANAASRTSSAAGGPTKQPLGPSYLAALFIAGYHLAYGRALAQGAAPAPLFAVALLAALPIVAIVLGHRNSRAAWRAFVARPLPIGIAGILATASFVIFLAGLARSGAGIAITVRNTSIIFAQAFALLLGEKISVRQAIGAGLVAAGAGLVGLSH